MTVKDIERNIHVFWQRKQTEREKRSSVGERTRQAEFAAQGHAYNSEKE
jgi:hypothetical protein